MGFDEKRRYLVPLFVLTQVTGLAAGVCKLYNSIVLEQRFTTGTVNVIALGYLNGTAMVLFRVFPGSKKIVLKVTHAVIQFVVSALTISTLVHAIQLIYDTRPKNQQLATTHSWVATICVTLFLIQWIVGMFVFSVPSCQPRRAPYLIIHRYFGGLILAMAVITINLGTAESNNFKDFYELGYILQNMAGILMLLFGIIVGIILLVPSYKRLAVPKADLQRLT